MKEDMKTSTWRRKRRENNGPMNDTSTGNNAASINYDLAMIVMYGHDDEYIYYIDFKKPKKKDFHEQEMVVLKVVFL